jgi:hypothetical protein
LQRGVARATTDGALAQLGERLICIQEVNGSIPLGSTKDLHDHQGHLLDVFDHPVRDEGFGSLRTVGPDEIDIVQRETTSVSLVTPSMGLPAFDGAGDIVPSLVH